MSGSAINKDSATTKVRTPEVGLPAALAWRTGAWSAGIAIVINLIVLGLGRVAGADMNVQPPGSPAPMTIGVVQVVATVLVPLLVATGLLIAVRGRGARAWRLLAAVGLAVGLITVAMPVLATATAATTTVLATMHVVTGLAWFILVWRAARRAQDVAR
jgi:Family of unknown function (DUF6069)